MSLRGEPTIEEVLEKIADVWSLVPEISLSRVLSNTFCMMGYSPEQYPDLLFMGIADSKVMKGLDDYKRLIEEHR